eukprot:jgi/Hompol1/5487/HPOL_001987-RA
MAHISEHLYSFESSSRVSDALDAVLERLSSEAIARNGVFSVGVSGGSLPNVLAATLRHNPRIDFSRWRVVYADERCVPHEHSDSNHGAAVTALFAAIPGINKDNIVAIDAALCTDPAAAADDYSRRLLAAVVDRTHPSTDHSSDPASTSRPLPRIDALLLGMGPDGHTCSLFPGHPLLDERNLLVAPIFDSPKPPPQRITLTLPVVNAAHNVIFVATGDSKANVLHRMVDLHEDFPSARVKPTSGNLYWFIDAGAASSLSAKPLQFKL